MKRYCKNFEFTEDFILKCLTLCLKKRWKRKDVSWFLAQYLIKFEISNKKEYELAKLVHKYILSGGKEDIKLYILPLIAKDMLAEIESQSIALKPIKYEERIDKASGKIRNIGISSIKQQVYDYIVVYAIKDMLDAKIGKYQCASIKGRGQIYGVRAIKRWLVNNNANTKYYCKEDIHKCYPSIPHGTIKKLLARDVKNQTIVYVIYTLIDTYREGLCIGSYLCQYLANYYLSYVWHFIDNNCYTIRRGKRVNYISYKLFYMDDIILFSPNLKNLKKARRMISDYLGVELKLKFKSDNNYRRSYECIDMMGYRICKDCIIMRRRNWKRMRRLFLKYKNKSRKMCEQVARKIASYYGMVVNSNSVKIDKKYNIKNTVNRAKEVIRCEAKEDSQISLLKNTIISCVPMETQIYLSTI